MPKFVIEREIPAAGKRSERDLKAVSQKSVKVLGQMGPMNSMNRSGAASLVVPSEYLEVVGTLR